MNFLRKIQNSIYSPEFYSNSQKFSFSSALGYFAILILILTVAQSIYPIWLFSTAGQREIKNLTSRVSSAYPKELEVKIINGKVSTNVKEPYAIAIPSEDNSGQRENLVVLDTKTPYSAAKFNEYRSLIWVTRDSVFVKEDKNGQTRAFDLSSANNFTLNKNAVDSFAVKASPWLKLITPVVIIAILAGIFFIYFLRLFYFLFLALLVFILLKLIKKPLSYGKAYMVVLYAVTLGFIVEAITIIVHQQSFPFMLTVITLLVVLFNFYSQPNKVTPQKKAK